MKSKRQEEILRLIAQQDIETQEQMMAALEAVGIKATQATISRDIKALNLIKQPSEQGVNRYVAAPAPQAHHSFSGRLRHIFREGVTSFDVAQNIVVIKTVTGLAQAAGAALDGMAIEGFVGSLAGDDTVILIMRSNQVAEEFCRDLKSMLD